MLLSYGSFLSVSLSAGQIQGIGPGRVATLASYGIETAYDITRSALGNVPGFGHVLVGNLRAWRNSVESRFVFDPNKGVDPDDIRSIEQEIIARRIQLETRLISGVSELRQINALPEVSDGREEAPGTGS